MFCARAFDPVEREYHELGSDTPSDWPVEWGFYNSDGRRFYHGDILYIPWLRRKVTVVHYQATKMSVGMFLYDYRRPSKAIPEHPAYEKRSATCSKARPAFRDSRIEYLGSWRLPRVIRRVATTPEPVKEEPERVDIYARIKEKDNGSTT